MKVRLERQQRGGLELGTPPIDYDGGAEVLSYAGPKSDEAQINKCNRKSVNCKWFRKNVCKRKSWALGFVEIPQGS
jgi:hypothetical protein